MDKTDLERYERWHEMILEGKKIGLSPAETMIFTGMVMSVEQEGKTVNELKNDVKTLEKLTLGYLDAVKE